MENAISDTHAGEVEPMVKELKDNFNILSRMALKFRKSQLIALKRSLLKHEDVLVKAYEKDLGMDVSNATLSGLPPIVKSIDYCVEMLDEWAADRHIPTPLVDWPSKCYLKPQGKGVYCVMGAWNVPVFTTIEPVIYAIAAGNSVIVKPSEFSPASSNYMKLVCDECFDPRFYRCIEGGVQTGIALTNSRLDGLVFTGGTWTGKLVAQAASKNLYPCILELGGKSPAVVDCNCDLDLTAKKIAYTKWLNNGQVCVDVDYCLIHGKVYDEFIKLLKHYTEKFYGKDAINNKWYSRMIHTAHAENTWKLLEGLKENNQIIYQGGKPDTANKFLPPTIVEIGDNDLDKPIMQNEIFGPILIVKKFNRQDEVIDLINSKGRPLVIHYFGNVDSPFMKNLVTRTRSGSVVTNDVIFPTLNNKMPFGGIGDSGMGSLHTRDCFDQMSVMRSVVERPNGNLKGLNSIGASKNCDFIYDKNKSSDDIVRIMKGKKHSFTIKPYDYLYMMKLLFFVLILFFLMKFQFVVIEFPKFSS